MGLFDKLKGLVLGIQEAQRQKAAADKAAASAGDAPASATDEPAGSTTAPAPTPPDARGPREDPPA